MGHRPWADAHRPLAYGPSACGPSAYGPSADRPPPPEFQFWYARISKNTFLFFRKCYLVGQRREQVSVAPILFELLFVPQSTNKCLGKQLATVCWPLVIPLPVRDWLNRCVKQPPRKSSGQRRNISIVRKRKNDGLDIRFKFSSRIFVTVSFHLSLEQNSWSSALALYPTIVIVIIIILI